MSKYGHPVYTEDINFWPTLFKSFVYQSAAKAPKYK